MSSNYLNYVVGARLGSTEDFGELVVLFQSRLFGYVQRFVFNADDAEELVQESFIRAWERMAELRSADAFPSWLWRIARNMALAHRRTAVKGREISRASLEDDPDTRPLELRPDWAFMTKTLSSAQRTVLELRYIAGFSHREIASVTGTDEARVKSRIHEAKEKLRKQGLSPLVRGKTSRNSIELKEKIMSRIDAQRLAAHIFERLGLVQQIEFAKAARDKLAFGESLLTSIGRIEQGREFLTLYGSKLSLDELIGILNHVDRHTEMRLVETLERQDAVLAEEIKQNLFVFEDMVLLDQAAIRFIAQHVDIDILATATAGTTVEAREHIAGMLDEKTGRELAARMAQVDAGHKRVKFAEESIIDTIRDLMERGELKVFRDEKTNRVVVTA